jgi:hypothetical protein
MHLFVPHWCYCYLKNAQQSDGFRNKYTRTWLYLSLIPVQGLLKVLPCIWHSSLITSHIWLHGPYSFIHERDSFTAPAEGQSLFHCVDHLTLNSQCAVVQSVAQHKDHSHSFCYSTLFFVWFAFSFDTWARIYLLFGQSMECEISSSHGGEYDV